MDTAAQLIKADYGTAQQRQVAEQQPFKDLRPREYHPPAHVSLSKPMQVLRTVQQPMQQAMQQAMHQPTQRPVQQQQQQQPQPAYYHQPMPAAAPKGPEACCCAMSLLVFSTGEWCVAARRCNARGVTIVEHWLTGDCRALLKLDRNTVTWVHHDRRAAQRGAGVQLLF